MKETWHDPPMSLKSITVNLPFVSGTWEVDDAQRQAAWEMYVELVTRISVQPLEPDEGLLREALSSLHSLFGETRRIMRAAGPGVARPRRGELLTFGQIAVDVLNVLVRPVIAKWHPLLLEHEASRGAKSATEHERAWDKANALREVLAGLRKQVSEYADLLADACDVARLHETHVQ